MKLFLPWDCGFDWAHTSKIRLHFSLDAKLLILRPQALEWETELFLEGLCLDNAADIGSKPLSVFLLLLTLYTVCLSLFFLSLLLSFWHHRKPMMQQIQLTVLL